MSARARTEFLETPGIHFRHIDVAFLVGCHAVHAPERAREIADRAPRVDETSVEFVFEHLVRKAIEGHKLAIIAYMEIVKARGLHIDAPLGKILAVLVEDLDTVVVA